MEDLKKMLPKDTIFFPEQPDNVRIKVKWTGKVLYELRRPYCYVWEHGGVKRAIYVCKGFKNDGASVFRIVQTLSGLHQDSMRAASIIHDLIYANQGRFPNKDGAYYRKDNSWKMLQVTVPRKVADRLFGRINREDGLPENLRRRAFQVVDKLGWIAWGT